MALINFILGESARVDFTFTDEQQDPPLLTDPVSITMTIQPQDGTPMVWTWNPTDGGTGQFVHDSTGKFHVLIPVPSDSDPGVWAVFAVGVLPSGVNAEQDGTFRTRAPSTTGGS